MTNKGYKYIVAIIIFGVFYGASQYLIAAEESKQDSQQTLFLKAEKALKNNNDKAFEALLPQLKDYPLYPYLIYEKLSKNVTEENESQIKAFLEKYPKLPPAEDLREQWFKLLAKNKQWNKIIENYPTKYKTTAANQCLYIQAFINIGEIAQTTSAIPALWLVSKQQPTVCMPVFEAWAKQGYAKDDLIWERIGLTLKAGNVELAKKLLKLLPPNEQKVGQIWLNTHSDPASIAKNINLDKDHKQVNPIVTHGLTKLAENDPNTAYKKWHKLAEEYGLSADQKQTVKEAIALGLIKKDASAAQHKVKQLKTATNNKNVAEWMLRELIKNRNMEQVKGLVEALPQKEQAKLNWRYWYAKSLEALGQKDKAHNIYTSISAVPSYYGVLAANKISRKLPITYYRIDISNSERNAVLANPNIQRAEALYQLKRYNVGDKEWWTAIDNLSDKQDYVAAKVAQEWGMNNIAIATGNKIKGKKDFTLLYPLDYESTIAKAAKKNDIEQAWIYAIIRQESRFHPSAKSSVGAKGLMQLMPGTAKDVARKSKGAISPSNINLLDPTTNIHLGSAYLSDLLDSWGEYGILATASYNAGPGNVRKWIPKDDAMPVDEWVEIIPFNETRTYVKHVLLNTVVYQDRLKQKDTMKKHLKDIPVDAKYQ